MAKFMNLVRNRMGVVQTRPPQSIAVPTPVVSIACDDCGGIFTLPADFTRTERKKRCTRYADHYACMCEIIIVFKFTILRQDCFSYCSAFPYFPYRCAARVAEEKIAQSPYSRKVTEQKETIALINQFSFLQCALCQMIFNVSPKIAELPSGVMVNCQR